MKEKHSNELSHKGLEFVIFYAVWCPHCKKVKQDWIKIAKTLPQYQFSAIDVEKSPEMTKKLDIIQVPSTWIFKDGRPSRRYEQVSVEKAVEDFLRLK